MREADADAPVAKTQICTSKLPSEQRRLAERFFNKIDALAESQPAAPNSPEDFLARTSSSRSACGFATQTECRLLSEVGGRTNVRTWRALQPLPPDRAGTRAGSDGFLAAGADGLRQEVWRIPGWQPTTVLTACIATSGLRMSPISRLERAPLHASFI